MDTSKIVNYHGWKIYQDYGRGYGPYFLNTLMTRIHAKKATNIVVTGEAGEGKSYMACDIARTLMGFKKNGEERFSLDQVIFLYKDFMELTLKLPMGYPIVFDEPSYAMSHREWYKQLNKALVQTVESMRFKVHPFIVPIINKSLLDKTIRSHLIQYQVLVHGRGKATVYRIHSSQFEDRVYHKYFCDLQYAMLDIDKCARDSCLDCPNILECNLFRARYERKKASIQEARYSQALAEAESTESKMLTIEQIEKLSLTLAELFIKKGRISVQSLRIALSDEYGIRLSNTRAYELRALLLKHHPEILDV